jgi:hypothetical protein
MLADGLNQSEKIVAKDLSKARKFDMIVDAV